MWLQLGCFVAICPEIAVNHSHAQQNNLRPFSHSRIFLGRRTCYLLTVNTELRYGPASMRACMRNRSVDLVNAPFAGGNYGTRIHADPLGSVNDPADGLRSALIGVHRLLRPETAS